MTVEELLTTIALVALICFIPWAGCAFAEDKKQCEAAGGVLVRGSSFEGFVCIDAKAVKA